MKPGSRRSGSLKPGARRQVHHADSEVEEAQGLDPDRICVRREQDSHRPGTWGGDCPARGHGRGRRRPVSGFERHHRPVRIGKSSSYCVYDAVPAELVAHIENKDVFRRKSRRCVPPRARAVTSAVKTRVVYGCLRSRLLMLLSEGSVVALAAGTSILTTALSIALGDGTATRCLAPALLAAPARDGLV
jgi:hypothetical protein